MVAFLCACDYSIREYGPVYAEFLRKSLGWRMTIEYKPRHYGFGEISSDVVCHAPGHCVAWLPREAVTLPVWPEFVGSIHYRPDGYVMHGVYYLYAFELPLKGSLRIVERGIETRIDPGMIGIIHRGEDSRLFTSDEDGCRKLAFGMHGVALGGIVAAAGLAGRIALHIRDPERLIRLVLQLESLLGMRRIADIPRIAGLGMEILTELALCAAAPRDERLELAVNLFAINVPNRMPVSQIAAACNISPATLGRLFRQEFGRSPQAYFRDLRMQTARGLLADLTLPVKCIAAQVGFADVFAFSREFRKTEGISPREFRRRLAKAEPEWNQDDRSG